MRGMSIKGKAELAGLNRNARLKYWLARHSHSKRSAREKVNERESESLTCLHLPPYSNVN